MPIRGLLQTNSISANASSAEKKSVRTGTVMYKVPGGLNPLIGASVDVIGKNKGTITDAEGVFTLNGLVKGDKIRVSYIGYKPYIYEYKGFYESIIMKEDK